MYIETYWLNDCFNLIRRLSKHLQLGCTNSCRTKSSYSLEVFENHTARNECHITIIERYLWLPLRNKFCRCSFWDIKKTIYLIALYCLTCFRYIVVMPCDTSTLKTIQLTNHSTCNRSVIVVDNTTREFLWLPSTHQRCKEKDDNKRKNHHTTDVDGVMYHQSNFTSREINNPSYV